LVSQLCLFLYYPTYRVLATGSGTSVLYKDLYPTSDITTEWTYTSTPHWSQVDEVYTSPNTADYVATADTSYLNESWGLADYTPSPALPTDYAIINVTLYEYATRTGTCGFYLQIKTNSVFYSVSKSLNATAWTWVSNTWTTNPNTSLAWTWAQINAMEVGCKGKQTLGMPEVADCYVRVYYGYTAAASVPPNQDFCYVDDVAGTTNHTNVGTTPYLDMVDYGADSGNNYINLTGANNGTTQTFYFANTVLNTSGTLFGTVSTFLEFRIYEMGTTGHYYYFNVTQGTVYQEFTYTCIGALAGTWFWTSVNITALVDTITEVNNTRFVLKPKYGNQGTLFDCARLNVTYQEPVTSANTLNICYYNNTETNWVGTGSDPYLNPSMDNYFTYSITNGNASWFSFENTTQTPQQVFLELQGYTGSGIQISPYLNNGSATTQLSARVMFGVSTTWFEWNVTNILSTTATINAAILKLQYMNTTGSNMYIYTARLRLYSHCYPYSNLVNVSTNQIYADATFSCYWYDSVALNVSTLTHNANGSYVNVTVVLSGTSAWGNFTVTLPATTTDITYWFTANDTAGNEERTSNNFTLSVIWNSTTTFTKINTNTATTAHTLGRKSITGNGRVWIGYPVLVGAIYQLWCNSSVDGVAWISAAMIRDNIDVIGTGFWYMSESCDGGVWHIHVHWCNETATISPVEYRRGILNSNGTITWETDWQTAVPAQSGRNLAVNGITTTPNGTTYMQYTSRTSGLDICMWLSKNSLQNGTWSTASGYPLNVTSPNFYSMEGYPYALNDTTVYCFMTSKMGGVDGKIMGRYVVDNALSTVENITVRYETEGRDFSTAIDGAGNLHLTYCSTDSLLYYCRRNVTLGMWDVVDEAFGGGSNFPAISVNTVGNVPYVYVNWVAPEVNAESGVYLNMRNSTAWTYGTGTRILSLTPYGLTSQVDPNTIPQNSTTFVTFILSVTNVTDAQDQLWTLTYRFPYGIEYQYSFADSILPLVSLLWNKGLQFITTATTHSTNTLTFLKELGYAFLSTTTPTATIIYGKALEYATILTASLTDTSTFFKELGYGFLDTGKSTATMTYNLAAIFLNLEYTFTQPALPQAFLTVQKELQFNILQTVQSIANFVWNKATSTTFWEYTFMQSTIPQAFLVMQKERQFTFTQTLQALATLIMNKALKITLWEMIDVAHPETTLFLSTTVPTSYATKAFVAAMFFMLILIGLPALMLILARKK
jgi:hypothetical protein